MTLVAILIATLIAGVGSVWIAAAILRLGTRADTDGSIEHGSQALLSLAAGALLATAFTHLLPEAFESTIKPAVLFAVLLVGLVAFFLLDKAELWHHGHEHHEHEHPPHDAQARMSPSVGSWSVLSGDSVHCFGDGVLIASAFIANWRLGLLAALAVLTHEVPHHIGDLVVLKQSSTSWRDALIKVSFAGAFTVLGGLIGWWLVDQLGSLLPYFLVLASSSFAYVALADLIPQLQKRLSARQTGLQIGTLLLGIALVTGVSVLSHGADGHEHHEGGHEHHESGHEVHH